jgi:Putative Ig domain
LISGLLGTKGAAGGGPGTPAKTAPLYVVLSPIAGFKRTPFTFNVGYNLALAPKPTTDNAAPGGPGQQVTSIHDAYIGVPYSEHLPFEGGVGTKTYAIGPGNQPPTGLTVHSDGILEGTATQIGTSTFVVHVTDSAQPPNSSVAVYKINVVVAPGSLDALKGGAPTTKLPSTTTDAKSATTANDSSSNQQQAAVVDCSAVDDKTPCSFKRSFRAQDKEYWDIGLAVAVPGVKERTFTLTNGTATSSVTRHTDVYAFLDVYPLAHWFDKRGPAPHFALGLPVTSQTFYRPFFGAAENFTNWTGLRRLGFPLEMSVFAGVVDMRIQVPMQSTSGTTLLATRTVKPMYGLELSVSDLVSKLGSKSKK